MAQKVYWGRLHDAYGSAEVVPELLSQIRQTTLEGSENQATWFDLWSRLYHQDSIYSASYAAVPLLVNILGEVPREKVTMDYFLLPVCIEIARHSDLAPVIPKEVEEDYLTALKRLGELAAPYENEKDLYLGRSASAARFVAKGDILRAKELVDNQH